MEQVLSRTTKKEYAIFKRVNNATPYVSNTFSNLSQVDIYFQEIENRHKKFNQTFYIDRVGYKNYYPKELAQFYYKVLERPINEWQELL